MPQPCRIVFSDVDGTLVHYPRDPEEYATNHDSNHNKENDNAIWKLPPSATGTRGVISERTWALAQDIRRRGVPLVLISGMRTSTLLARLPYLPRADAYCTEAGGRIFYPVSLEQRDDKRAMGRFQPLDERTPAFGLVEDLTWRAQWEAAHAAGQAGFVGNELGQLLLLDNDSMPVPIADRDGLLWKFAAQLQNEGLVIDSKSYSTCFRVNRKQQRASPQDVLFLDLLHGRRSCPAGLATSTNLGCVDVYPVASGKKNCCQYLASQVFGIENMSEQSVCICDDDNDIEMALACSHALIPSLSSTTMEQTMTAHPTQFTRTFGEQERLTRATEAALELILTQYLGTK